MLCNNLPPAFQQFIDDDVLMGDLAGESVGGVEIHGVEDVSLRVLAECFERGPVKHRAAVAVVNVLLHEHMTGTGDLLLQLNDLALDRLLLLLLVRAHPLEHLTKRLNR